MKCKKKIETNSCVLVPKIKLVINQSNSIDHFVADHSRQVLHVISGDIEVGGRRGVRNYLYEVLANTPLIYTLLFFQMMV